MNVKDILNQTSQKEQVRETAAAGTDAEPDMSYIIRKIDQIMDDSRYIRDALGQLEHAEGDTAMAISNVVENRERTNQYMIELLQKMLEATNPQTKDTGVTKLEITYTGYTANPISQIPRSGNWGNGSGRYADA